MSDRPRDATGVPLSIDAPRMGTSEQLHEAYRKRAGLIALLGTCLCRFPVVIHETASSHHPACPSELMYASIEKAKETSR